MLYPVCTDWMTLLERTWAMDFSLMSIRPVFSVLLFSCDFDSFQEKMLIMQVVYGDFRKYYSYLYLSVVIKWIDMPMSTEKEKNSE